MRRIPMLLIAVFLLAACGKKGNLYLPDTQTKPVSTQSSSK